MSKVTSKFQVSIPKSLAEKVGIRVGDDLAWEEATGTLRVRLSRDLRSPISVEQRLHSFDAATRRQKERERRRRLPRTQGRGWKREDLYRR